jgi:hypothetical protein
MADMASAIEPAISSVPTRRRISAEANKLGSDDRAAHDWYRFVLSYPPHLVREYLMRFGGSLEKHVLDPFCGTGTTIVECKKNRIPSIGVEAHPMAHFASATKVDWDLDPAELEDSSRRVAAAAIAELEASGIIDDPEPALIAEMPDRQKLRILSPEIEKLLLTNSISPLPLHKTLVLRDAIRSQGSERCRSHQLLALAKALVTTVGNLEFGPEVGVGPAKADAPVVSRWLRLIQEMIDDLRTLKPLASVPAETHRADSRDIAKLVAPESIDIVITSPPYPNEKDYTRTTRLETRNPEKPWRSDLYLSLPRRVAKLNYRQGS